MAEKDKLMNWINSWKEGNKKEKYNMEIRLGKLTILEMKYCACSVKKCANFRVMMFNLGFEI